MVSSLMSLSCSPHGDAVCKYIWLFVVVLCRCVEGSGFWSGYALVYAVYTLFICLLVQTPVWSVQVHTRTHTHCTFVES